ncbi:glycosyltransferase [Corynebacteriaceae bacterium 7-707]
MTGSTVPPRPSGPIEAVSVVLPVHDEEETVAAAVRSIAGAARALTVPVSLTVVFDRCSDASETRVAEVVGSPGACGRLEVRTMSGYFPHIGAVRNAGVADATTWGAVAGVPLHRHWTAHTDADSVVPPHWLRTQLEDADAGYGLVTGTVVPDEPPGTPAARQWAAHHTLGEGHTSVHGANLGVRLDLLLAVGGFVDVAVGEDVRTVALLKDMGVPWTATDRGRVLTSARRTGRIVDGFAGYLRTCDGSAGSDEPPVGA